MLSFGIDIGSTTSKCVLLKNGQDILAASVIAGGIGTDSPKEAVEETLRKAGVDMGEIGCTVATGYGRNRYVGADFIVSELNCHAIGARMLFPTARTVIDIGGQDAKVIALSPTGTMRNFLMNDKCAAGTGRFLDVMASVLRVPVNEMAEVASYAREPVSISSTCTVFAESEVISQLANGVEMPDLVAGICNSVAVRVGALAKRLDIQSDVCMSGGVAQNKAVRDALSRSIGRPILFSTHAQLFGALGAACYGWKKCGR